MAKSRVRSTMRAVILAFALTIGLGTPGSAQTGSRVLAEPAPRNQILVAEGVFHDGDPAHRGSGLVRVYRAQEGDLMLRLESIAIGSGPDLFVYLAADPDPLFPEDVLAGYLSLGRLKGRFGDQNYAIPDGADLGEWGSVVVWCEEFSVAFAIAPLKAPN